MKIVALASHDDPTLAPLLQILLQKGVVLDGVIIDQKGWSEKDRELHHERTEGRLDGYGLDCIEEQMISFYYVSNHNSSLACKILRKLDAQLIINCGTPRILKGEIFKVAEFGIIGCHPGLLPDFRGCTCPEWALYLGEKVGNTAFFLTEGIDEGEVIVKKEVNLNGCQTYADFRCRVQSEGWMLLAEAVCSVVKKKIKPSKSISAMKGKYFKPMPPDIFCKLKEKFPL